jgi:hypothetical protein
MQTGLDFSYTTKYAEVSRYRLQFSGLMMAGPNSVIFLIFSLLSLDGFSYYIHNQSRKKREKARNGSNNPFQPKGKLVLDFPANSVRYEMEKRNGNSVLLP